MRRIALFSDVHGNLPALEAVLADIDTAGIKELYCLGDLVGYGPDPVGVIDRMRALWIPTLQGNYDDGVGNRRGECGCTFSCERAERDGQASYAFTTRTVDDEHAAWLAALPPAIRFEEAGARVLLVHGSPRRANEYLTPDLPEDLLARLADICEADLVCAGHVHIAYHRRVEREDGPAHYVNPGSAGWSKERDSRASWMELAIGTEDEVREALPDDTSAGPAGSTETWVGTAVHRVDYDVEKVGREIVRLGLPSTLAATLRHA